MTIELASPILLFNAFAGSLAAIVVYHLIFRRKKQ